MKLNSISTHNQFMKIKANLSFGLLIKKDKEFYQLIENLKDDCQFSDAKMSRLHHIDEGIFFDTYEGTSIQRAAAIDYRF